MWPVRSRRGTRKRCAALFIVGLCAAIMIVTRPFIMTTGGNSVNQVAEPMALLSNSPFNTSSSLTTNDSTTENNRLGFQSLSLAAIQSTSEKIESGSPPPVSMVIKPEFIQEPLVVMMKLEEQSEKSFLDNVKEMNNDDTPSSVSTSQSSLVSSGPLMAAPTTKPSTTSSRKPSLSTVTTPTSSITLNANNTKSSVPSPPTVYILTPTFPRMEQMAELTRLGQTLMLLNDIHWVVVDDAPKKSVEVESLLKRTNIPYTYLVAQMPETYRKKKGSKPKGVANRLAGLKWIKEHGNDNGVMFFADDDNSYDIRLFEEMRWTKKVSMWPVGLVTQLGVSTPVVKDGRVIDFYDGWVSTRKFPVDMAGFAVNVGFLKTRPNVTMPYKAGFEEDGFLRSLSITIKDIEPKASNCTKILVWHTKTVGNKPPQKISAKDRKRFNNTNIFSFPHIV